MASAALEIIISAKDSASGPIGKTAGAISNLGKLADHTHGILSGVLTGVGFAAFNAGIAGVSSGFHALSGFIGDSIQESRDAAHGLAQTEAAIKSTGGAAGITAQEIVNLSGSLSKMTLFTDDAIQQTSNLLLTFTGIQNKAGEGNDIFNQATKISLDLAQAMGTDAAGGAIQLGKALNDPAKGITALTRVGVTFTDQQKNQIKTLQASGNVMGAQKIILAELNKEFGGSAEAAMKADGGFHLFQQRLSDVKQTIGDSLQPALQSLMGFLSGPGMDVIEGIGTSIASGLNTAVPAIEGFVTKAITTFRALGGGDGVGGVVQMIIGAVGDLIPGLQPITAFLQDHFWAAWFAGEHAIALVRDAFITFTQAISGNWVDASGILPFHQAIGEIGLFVRDTAIPAFSALAGWIGQNAGFLTDLTLSVGAAYIAFQTMSTAVSTVSTIMEALGVATAVLSSPIGLIALGVGALGLAITTNLGSFTTFAVWVGNIASSIMSGDWATAWATVTAGISGVGDTLATAASTWGSQIVAWIPTAITDVQAALPGIWDAVSTWIIDTATTIGSTLATWGSAFVSWVGPAIPPFLEAVGAFATSIGTAIVTGVPIIAERVALWANELVAWVQRDALPKLQPAFDAFLAELGRQADRGKAVLAAKGTEAGTSLTDGLKAGMIAAPIVVGVILDNTANIIISKGPVFNTVATVLGKTLIDSFFNFIMSDTPGKIAAWGAAATQAILAIGPNMGQTALGIGALAATALYNGLTNTLITYRGQLLHLGIAVATWVSDGITQAESLAVYAAARLGQAILSGILAPLAGLASSVAGIVNRALGGAMAVIQSVQRIHSPSRKWADEVGKPMAQGIAAGFVEGMGAVTPAMVKQLDEASKVVSAAADAVTKGTTAFPLLKTFKAPSIASINNFTDSVMVVVQSLGSIAQIFKAKWLEHAQVFFDAAGKGLGVISSGVDGLNKLRTFRAPSIANVNAFTDSVLVVVQSLGTAATIFKNDWLTHAQTFFDTAGKGLGIIGSGVDGLTKLQTFKAPSIANVNAFTDTVLVIVQSLGTAATILKDAWLTHAAAFEDTAGKGLAIIGSGVDGLTKLINFKAPSVAAMNAFTDTVLLTVQSLGTAATIFKDAWLTHASAFTDTAGKGLGIIGSGIEGLSKLRTFRAPSIASVAAFGDTLRLVVDTMRAVATSFDADMVAATAVFADAAGKIIAPIKAVVDTFTSVKNYTGIAPAAFRLLAQDLDGVIQTMVIIAQHVSADGVAAAAAFGDATGKVMAGLKSTIDTFTDLNKYKGVAPAAVKLLLTDLYGVVGSLQGFFAAAGGALADADTWQTQMRAVADAVKAGVDALGEIAGIDKQGSAISAGLGVLASGFTGLQATLSAIDWSGMIGAWQTSFQVLFTSIMDTIFLPWQTATRDFFSGAGFGFIGAASEGINSAGGGLAASAGNVGGAAGASLVSGLRGNLPGVTGFVSDVNGILAGIERDITIHVHTEYDDGTPAHRAMGGPVRAGTPYIVGETRPELFVPQTNGYIVPTVPASRPASGGGGASTNSISITFGDIYQQPGEDTDALVDRLVSGISDRLDARDRLRTYR